MFFYSPSTDLAYDSSVNKNIPDDKVEISPYEMQVHMGNVINDGKRRVKHAYPFVFEDIPQPSNYELFSAEFKARKAEYDAAIQSLTIAMAGIILKDGPNETDKKAELQALESATTAEYNQDIATLRDKYYG